MFLFTVDSNEQDVSALFLWMMRVRGSELVKS